MAKNYVVFLYPKNRRKGVEVMSWEIVVGIGTLASFVVGAIKFLTPLTDALTRLTEECNNLNKNMERLEKENNEKEKELKEIIQKLENHINDFKKEIDEELKTEQDRRLNGTTRLGERVTTLEAKIHDIEKELILLQKAP